MRPDATKRELLRRLPLFSACSGADLKLIERNVTSHRFVAGEVLMREGTVGSEFFVLVEGTATVTIDGQAVDRVEAGGYVGELALLDGRPRIATVVADTDLDVLVCNPREFAACIDISPAVSRHLLRGMTGHLRAAHAAVAASATL